MITKHRVIPIQQLQACKMYNTLKQVGITPILNWIDSKKSQELITEIESKGLKYQIVPLGNHVTLLAERVIQIFKNHFKSILHGCDPGYPKNKWDGLIDVAILTLNMIQPSRINQRKSAYNEIWDNFYFNKIPLASPGYFIVAQTSTGPRSMGRPWSKRILYWTSNKPLPML